MAWRGRGKGSSDVIKRGAAFRPTTAETYEPFPDSHIVNPPLELTPNDGELVNIQRLLVNHLLNPGDDGLMRVHLGASESHILALADGGANRRELWKRLAEEVGACYYPSELMTDSRSAMMGTAKKASSNSAKVAKSLAALENSEGKGETEVDGDQSPKSVAEESESDESLGGEDYNVRFDYEDEGARDDYDDGDDGGGGGDYGGEF
jgi:hypothetical protein